MVSVTVTFDEPGTTPPVYVAGSFTDWAPLELDVTTEDENSSTKFKFSKDIEVSAGDHQYKFRLGPGDWWICDSTKPMGDDGSGNVNNVFNVPEPSKAVNGHAKQMAEPEAAPSEDSNILTQQFSNIKNYAAITEEKVTKSVEQPTKLPESETLEAVDEPSKIIDSAIDSTSAVASQTADKAQEIYSKLPPVSALPEKISEVVADKAPVAQTTDNAVKESEKSRGTSTVTDEPVKSSWLSQNKTTIAIVLIIPIVISWFVRR